MQANKAADTPGDKKEPLFRACRVANNLGENATPRADVLAIIKWRAETAALLHVLSHIENPFAGYPRSP